MPRPPPDDLDDLDEPAAPDAPDDLNDTDAPVLPPDPQEDSMSLVARLAADDTLFTRLGAADYGRLIRLASAASPALDIPGGVCWTGSMSDLAALLGVKDRGTAANVLTRLQAHRLLVRIEGASLGYRLGRLGSRVYLTVYGIPAPAPGDGGTPVALRDSRTDALGNNSPVNHPAEHSSLVSSSPTAPRHLSPVSSQLEDVSTGAVLDASDSRSVMMRDLSTLEETQAFTATGEPAEHLDPAPHPVEPATPASPPAPPDAKVLAHALALIGWHGALPPRERHYPALLLAGWLHRLPPEHAKRNPGAWLRKVLSLPGEAERLIEALGLSDVTALPAADPTAGVMTHDEWVQHQIQDPEWAEKAHATAIERAKDEGIEVTMLWVRQVATEMLTGRPALSEVYRQAF